MHIMILLSQCFQKNLISEALTVLMPSQAKVKSIFSGSESKWNISADTYIHKLNC